MSKKQSHPSCAECGVEDSLRICRADGGSASKGCPTLKGKDILSAANKEYDDPDVRHFAHQASLQEAQCYANRHVQPYVMQPSKTRIVEICEFAEKMSYKRLGLAFCAGLAKEAAIVGDLLLNRGFEVVSVICKAGRSPKTLLGLEKEQTIYHDENESMCNPIFQAKLLNHEKTEFNILLGLCVGHDSLFFRYAEAPVTVLAVKDRVTGHNPLAAIYLSDSYFRKIKNPELC
ncbi:MAG: DUF1847 domain-containing protein [Pseudomonadota bacterium]